MTVARKLQNASDLNAEEQQRVRGAIRHIHARVRDWMLVAKSLRFAKSTVTDMVYGRTPVSASMAFRVARFLGAPIDDLLAGRFTPPSTCPYCKQPVPD
jgi:plasmid maintenance system antidote protein VapI